MELTIENIFSKTNVKRAIRRMKRHSHARYSNDISPVELEEYWKLQGSKILGDIYCNQYCPKPMKCIYIPKKSGKIRKIHIPSTLDKMLQSATAIKVQGYYDNLLSKNNFGFRKGKSTKDAVQACLNHLNAGYSYMIRIDIEDCFGRINHGVLRDILFRIISDGRLIQWIMQIVRAPFIEKGLICIPAKGISQGSPLSPWLANIYLNELDEFCDSRAFPYVRYVDDISFFFREKNEAEKGLRDIEKFLKCELDLHINTDKTVPIDAGEIDFLGYTFSKRSGMYYPNVATRNLKKMEDRVNDYMKQEKVDSINKMFWNDLAAINRGWTNYYSNIPKEIILSSLRSIDYMEKIKIEDMNFDRIYTGILKSNFTFCEEWYMEKEEKDIIKRQIVLPSAADNT